MALILLRAVFILVTSGLGVAMIQSGLFLGSSDWAPLITLGSILILALVVIILDILTPRKRLETISAVYFGLMVGFFLSYMINIGLTPFYHSISDNASMVGKIQNASHLVLTVFMCYISISLLLQTRNDFRFIIPYVELSREWKGLHPYLLDKSVVIDGRILDLAGTMIFQTPLMIPRFIIEELKQMSESSEKICRVRGQRGLDVLEKLRKKPQIEFRIYDGEVSGGKDQSAEMKLVLLAKEIQAKLATTDTALLKVARLNDVEVLNLNDLANAMKPVFLAGEQCEIQVLKPGEEASQGVGYLSDGTMVVVEGGRPFIGKVVKITVTSVLQTSAGRMIFGKVSAS